MTPEEFAKYQRHLNAVRTNKFREQGKIEPRPLIFDEDFTVFIDDIPLKIKVPEPPQVMTKDQIRITNKPTSKSLF